jgi:hypothetical protein
MTAAIYPRKSSGRWGRGRPLMAAPSGSPRNCGGARQSGLGSAGRA